MTLRVRSVSLLLAAVACVQRQPVEPWEPKAAGDTAADTDTPDTGEDTGDSNGSDTDTGDSGDSGDSGDPGGDTATACAPSEGRFLYGLYEVVGGTCGTDTSLMSLYGFNTGFIVGEVTDETFVMSYDGTALTPVCTWSVGCGYTCEPAYAEANMSFLGIEAHVGYGIESSGAFTAPTTAEGSLSLSLSCIGAADACARIDALLQMTLPCDAEFSWDASL